MELKDFNEFIKSLSQEKMDYINGLCDENPISFSGNLANKECFTNFISFISGNNFGMTLRLLECYHEWLSEQLSHRC